VRRCIWPAVAVFLLGGQTAFAATLSEDVPIVGGSAAFAQALGISPPPDAPRFVGELTRLLYNVPEGRNPELDAKVQRLTTYLELVRQFQASLAAAARSDGSLALEMARQKGDRDRLKGFFDTIGLRLREKNRTYSVERTSNKEAAERVRLLKALGVELDTLQTRLNGGESVKIQVPTESVPVPLTPKLWSVMVFQREVAPRDLVAAILSDRNAALLCRGLASLDDQTLEFLEAHPAMLTRLYEHDATVFGVFGDSLRIRNGAVVPPGGAPAVPLWEALLGEKVSRPERFVRELFSDSQGRSAYLYNTLDHLDHARQAFAIGLPIRDTGIRLERFKALAEVARSGYGDWQIKVAPFIRPAHDLSMLLSRVRVNADGSIVEPRAVVFWSRSFESRDLPDDPAKRLRNLHEDGDVDAAWLAGQIVAGDFSERSVRFEQFTFGQRAFGGAAEKTLPDALVGVRAFPRFGMLMLALERMGARTPATFTAAARHADHLTSLDPDHAFVALSQFQGAIALLVRLVRVGSLEPSTAEALATALAATAPNEDGWYQRAIAKWMRGPVAEALALTRDEFDGGLEAALSGKSRTSGEGQLRSITWEGHRYTVDFARAERRRLQRIHEKTARISLDDVFALDSMAERLAKASSVAEIQETIMRLKAFPIPVPAMSGKQVVVPPGVDAPRPPREIVARAIGDLSKITKPKDVKKTAAVSESLGRLVDSMLSNAIRSLVYALDLGDPDATVIAGIDSSVRHDFGFVLQGPKEARGLSPWAEPKRVIAAGTPWHVQGALLNLDLALAPMGLRQVSKPVAGRPPVLTDNERDTYASTAALLDVSSLRDADRDAIADAIEQGRRRLQDLFARSPADASDVLRDETVVDGWRRRAALWAVEHRRDPFAFLSLAELLQLGQPAAQVALGPWGTAARRAETCICTRLDQPVQWFHLTGRPQLGVLATQMPDLNLRVAVLLHDLQLPAGLAKDVLLAATQDFIDETAPTDPDDWLTLVRTAQALKLERVEDYVAALAAAGPLWPDEGSGNGTRR
jgi:hypothetical protein